MPESEVAQLLQRIEQEYQAARDGMSGLASGTAKHDFIVHKMKRINACYQELSGLVGTQEAMKLIVETIERM